MKMGLLCISRGERARGGLALGCWLWHSQPDLITDLEPWRPKQPPGVGQRGRPHTLTSSCVQSTECSLGSKGFPILSKAQSEGAL